MSVLKIASSYLTSIHFKTSILLKKERQRESEERLRESDRRQVREAFLFIVGVNRSLISITLLSLCYNNNLACPLLVVFGLRSSKSAVNRGVSQADLEPPICFLKIGQLSSGPAQNCTLYKSLTTNDALFLICLSSLSSVCLCITLFLQV